MGAVLNHAIRVYNYAEKNKLKAHVSFANPLYLSNTRSDIIHTYFEMGNTAYKPRLGTLNYFDKWSLFHLKMPEHVSLSDANKIFWTYFSPKPFIKEKINTALRDIPGHKFDLSIHYRGTDKILEAPIASFFVFRDAIAAYRKDHHQLRHVFLATDEPDFERYIRQEFEDLHFHTYYLGSPGNHKHGRHFSDMSAEDKALEGIVNIFLLAESPFLIRSASHMSGVSKILNPAIRTLTLNRTHWNSTNFPEKQIIEEEATN
jgi:hypothetical protein